MTRRIKLFACLVALALNASAATWYIRTDGQDGNDGKSWETAQSSICLGIDNCKSGDTLLVEAGVYHEGIVLKEGVTIIGGWNVDEGERREARGESWNWSLSGHAERVTRGAVETRSWKTAH